MLLSAKQCTSPGGSQTRHHNAPETHQTKAEASVCLFGHLLKDPYRPFMWVLLLERELKQRRALHPRPHTELWQRIPGAPAHGFMSEPGTGTAATSVVEMLHHPANALIYPELAAEEKRWLEE